MRPEAGFVYLMMRSDGLWKLGSSRDVETRRRAWQAVFGQSVEVKQTWCMGARASIFVEMHAHKLLDAYRVSGQGSRELYDTTRRVVCAAVEAAIDAAEVHLPDGIMTIAKAPPGAAQFVPDDEYEPVRGADDRSHTFRRSCIDKIAAEWGRHPTRHEMIQLELAGECGASWADVRTRQGYVPGQVEPTQ